MPSVKAYQNVEIILSIIIENSPITISSLTEKVNVQMRDGSAGVPHINFSKRQVGSALKSFVKDGTIQKRVTTDPDLTAQLSEIVYFRPH